MKFVCLFSFLSLTLIANTHAQDGYCTTQAIAAVVAVDKISHPELSGSAQATFTGYSGIHTKKYSVQMEYSSTPDQDNSGKYLVLMYEYENKSGSLCEIDSIARAN